MSTSSEKTSKIVFEHARYAASKGLYVIPLHNPIFANGLVVCSCSKGPDCGRSTGKHPRFNGWQEDATTDVEQIYKWFQRFPKMNYGIATGGRSGIDVLDVDGEAGETTLSGMQSQYGNLPPTVTQISGSGGRHLLFRHTGQIKNEARFAPGLDFRTEGGLIVGPGSLHASGQRYRWDKELSPNDVAIAEMPPWLFDVAPKIGDLRKTSDAQRRNIADIIPDGERNQALFRFACSMRSQGADFDAILAALIVTNDTKCQPPLMHDELEKIADSATRYEPASTPRVYTKNGKFYSEQPDGAEPGPNIFTDNIFTLTEWFNRPVNNDWILDPLLRRGELAFLYGAPKSGKTFLAVDMLMAVATGGNWCGQRYVGHQPLNVVLAIGEGHHGLKGRIESALIKWETTTAAIGDKLRIVPIVPQLYPDAPNPQKNAERFIEAVMNSPVRPDLVVIDTYARAILGADENSNKDASLILDTLQVIQESLRCAILVIHHANKGMGELRGASAILGGADIVLKCSRDGSMRKLEVEFAKDIPEQPPVMFSLFPAKETGSVYVVWNEDDPISGGSLDDRMLAFFGREQGQWFTAKEIAEAVGSEAKTVIGRLWVMKARSQVLQRLRFPEKEKPSSHNPWEWRLFITEQNDEQE